MMFTKIDKKVLIWLIVALVVVLLLGLAVYRYMKDGGVRIQDTAGGIGVEIQAENAGVQGSSGGSLIVCADKCGDGVCQKTDPKCNNNLNCTCPETKEDCPQDCK